MFSDLDHSPIDLTTGTTGVDLKVVDSLCDKLYVKKVVWCIKYVQKHFSLNAR